MIAMKASDRFADGSDENAPETPLDLVHLAKQTLGDRSLEHEVLRLFLKQSDHYMQRVVEAASNDDRYAAAHTIKGSARNIGAWGVAEVAGDLEQAKEKDIQKDIAALRKELQNTCSFIRAILEEA